MNGTHPIVVGFVGFAALSVAAITLFGVRWPPALGSLVVVIPLIVIGLREIAQTST